MKTPYIFVAVFVLMISCDGLDTNTNLSQLFNKEEIEQLEFIEESYQGYIQTKYNCKNYNCYNKYLHHLLSFEYKGDLVIEFPKKNFIHIIENTDQYLLKEIWLNYENEEHKYLHMNREGKYYKFLRLLASSNQNVLDYMNSYESIDDFSPSLVAGSIPMFANEDFSNNELRLAIAIHFLSCSYKSSE